MSYRQEEVLQYIKEENIRFIRLAFCDAWERRKILPSCQMNYPALLQTEFRLMHRL